MENATIRKTPNLSRQTFTTSRLMDFFSVKELQAQTGHEVAEWALVILKELFDNVLDACEEAGIAPHVSITVDDSGITVVDNGPGIAAETVASILDFSTRTSSREAYVSPTRGAQGNALKTLIAMPFVLDGKTGRSEIHSQGVAHHIDIAVDHIRQKPVIDHRQESSVVKNGTLVRIGWPDSAGSILHDARARFLQIAEDFTWINPHLSLGCDWFGEALLIEATDSTWEKWKPSDPTSPHWYTPERFARLIAAYVAHDADHGRDRTVREFVSEFRGLSGTAKGKAVLEVLGLSRAPLASLIRNDAVDQEIAGTLLQAMQAESKPVKPAMLGAIGQAHFEKRFADAGCQMQSFDYKKTEGHDRQGIPVLIECGFAWLGENAADSRRLITGINWSVGLVNPFRQLGQHGHSLDSLLTEQYIRRYEPVIFAMHCACPRVEYLDRAKSSVVLS